jgi:hypothetical protein
MGAIIAGRPKMWAFLPASQGQPYLDHKGTLGRNEAARAKREFQGFDCVPAL